MLETSRERIKLLKAGLACKTIEQLYLRYHNLKIINIPILSEDMKFDLILSIAS